MFNYLTTISSVFTVVYSAALVGDMKKLPTITDEGINTHTHTHTHTHTQKKMPQNGVGSMQKKILGICPAPCVLHQ